MALDKLHSQIQLRYELNITIASRQINLTAIGAETTAGPTFRHDTTPLATLRSH